MERKQINTDLVNAVSILRNVRKYYIVHILRVAVKETATLILCPVLSLKTSIFTMMGNMGADIFDLEWVQATINLFTLFGWALFAAGTVVAVFDVAIEYQNGRANIKTTALNVLKGFFACSLIGVVPVELYKFCISLQNTFSKDLSAIYAGQQSLNLSGQSTSVLVGSFAVGANVSVSLLNLLCMIAFAYCVIKIFFANIKRGGILLIQIAVGSLYMFSVPRGYTDGFNQWIKQIAALCLTAFMQTTLLFLGLLTFPDHMLLGLGVLLSKLHNKNKTYVCSNYIYIHDFYINYLSIK